MIVLKFLTAVVTVIENVMALMVLLECVSVVLVFGGITFTNNTGPKSLELNLTEKKV